MGRMEMQAFAAVLIFAVLNPACSRARDFSEYRQAVTRNFLDPAAAEFRNERIAEAHDPEGRYMKLYCAEINGRNAFGGKTGFKPIFYVIEHQWAATDNVSVMRTKAGYASPPIDVRWNELWPDGCPSGSQSQLRYFS